MVDSERLRIQDRLQIERLLVSYCQHLDRMDLDSLARLFTEDCFVDYGDDPRLQSKGAECLARSLERMWRWTRTSHHLSNILVDFVDRDTARCSSYVHAWHERADGTSATILGQYHDLVMRHPGRWLIHRRRMVMNGCDAGFTVPIHQLDRQGPPDGWTAPDIDRPAEAAGSNSRASSP